MRLLAAWTPYLCLVLGLSLVTPRSAAADDMDLAISRLRTEDPMETGRFTPDNDDWRRLISQRGFALAAPMLSPARTTGYRGFYIGLETSIVGIDSGASYWQRGTEGDDMTLSENRFVTSTLPSMRLAIRKGLPYGLELGASLGHTFNTDTWIWGAELRIALLEGYREGVLGWFPDIAVRGAVRTLTGEEEAHITVPSFDIILSKPITLGSSATLSPIVAAQFMWILADSELIDPTPERDAIAECMPSFTRPPEGSTSNLICNGQSQDLGNNRVFDDVRAFRARMAIGAEFRYRLLTLSAVIHWDLIKPSEADSAMPSDLPRQWDFSFGIGTTY